MIFETTVLALAFLKLAKADCVDDCCFTIQTWKSLGQTTYLEEDDDCCGVIPGITCEVDKVTEINWKSKQLSGPLPGFESLRNIKTM